MSNFVHEKHNKLVGMRTREKMENREGREREISVERLRVR